MIDDELLVSRKDIFQEDMILETMSQHSIILCLQRDDTTMSQVRVMFDNIIDHIPSVEDRLNLNANIVESNEFEAAIVRI